MSDFNIRADSVDVEQLMEQIRARIREKRGVDYTEQQLKELAAVKLERFLDPRGVRSDLLEQYRKAQEQSEAAIPNYVFEEETLYQTHRAPIRFIRRLLNPLLKLFFNPDTIVQALNIQSRLNQRYVLRDVIDRLHFEVAHNLVVEMTRLGIEVKNLKMQVESLTSRLEFNERRARALESAVVYRPTDDYGHAPAPPAEGRPRPAGAADATAEAAGGRAAPPPAGPSPSDGPGQRSRRRRRRRGRRGGGPGAPSVAPAVALMGDRPDAEDQQPSATPAGPAADRSDSSSAEPAANVDAKPSDVGSASGPAPEPSVEPGSDQQ